MSDVAPKRRPPRTQRQEEVVALIEAEPGLSLRELAVRLGLARTSVTHLRGILRRAGYEPVTEWRRTGRRRAGATSRRPLDA